MKDEVVGDQTRFKDMKNEIKGQVSLGRKNTGMSAKENENK